jgi:site-specific DNA recombinase
MPVYPDRYALYARVSSQKQEQDGTIKSQVTALQEHAAAKGWTVADLYVDDGFSGTTLVRPGLDRLRDDARKGLFNHVLFLCPDRLSRDPFDATLIKRELSKLDIHIIYLDRTYDNSASGELLEDLEQSIAKYERRSFLDRSRRGTLQKLKDGHVWRSRPPLGYRYILPDPASQHPERRKHGVLEVVEDEAPIIRDIFAQSIAGRSLRWIASELIARGVTTRQGRNWSDAQIWRIIRNPLYSGMATYGRMKATEPKSPKTGYGKSDARVERPREEWLMIPVPAIVSPEDQASAITGLDKHKIMSKRNNKHNDLLAGLVYCGYPHRATDAPCARRMTTRGGRDGMDIYRVYRCTRLYLATEHAHSVKNCPGTVLARIIEPLVWERIVTLLQQPDILLAQMRAANETQQEGRARLEQELAAILALADEAQAKLSRLVTRNIEGKLDDETFDQMQPRLVAARDEARVRAQAAQRALEAGQEGVRRWENVQQYCAAVSKHLEEWNGPEHFAQRQELVRTLVDRVTVYPGSIAITGVLPCLDTASGDQLSYTDAGERKQRAMPFYELPC